MQTERNNEGRYSAQPYYTEFRLGFLLGHETLTQLVNETNVPTIEAAREPERSEPDHDSRSRSLPPRARRPNHRRLKPYPPPGPIVVGVKSASERPGVVW